MVVVELEVDWREWNNEDASVALHLDKFTLRSERDGHAQLGDLSSLRPPWILLGLPSLPAPSSSRQVSVQ